VASAPGYPIFVKGRFNRMARSLTFALIHRGSGRVYGLDMGKDHHNPTCTNVGEIHKHRWLESVRDKDAYVPRDITASTMDPSLVWQQFCAEAAIQHKGQIHEPPASQSELP
jgi:hypothetical protein